MINEKSLKAVKRSIFSSHFRKPLYRSYCFSRIPSTIEHLLTGQKRSTLPNDCFEKEIYDAVVLLFIDGFGWRFFEKYFEQFPFLQRFIDKGIASKITSQFPSTTAAHVTSINTNLEVGQTGIYEWFYYEPIADEVIAPLNFSIAGDKVLGNLEKKGVTPQAIFPENEFYAKLKKKQIDTFIIQPEDVVHSPYSCRITLGAHPVSYRTLDQGLKIISEAIMQPSLRKGYYSLYFSDLDSAGHRYGVESQKFNEVLARCMDSLERFFNETFVKSSKKVALCLTADHGMVEINPSTTRFLNQEIPDFIDWIKKNKRGAPIVPAGSCRDFFLHIESSYLKKAKKVLENQFSSCAEVYEVKDLIDQGFFGSRPVSDRFLERVGDLVILPYAKESVWWYQKGKFEQNFYASHGGLTPEEMESLFLFYSHKK